MTEVIAKIANGLGLPTNASRTELLLMIKGKLVEEEHEPKNVPINVIDRGRLTLKVECGVILNIPANEGAEEK